MSDELVLRLYATDARLSELHNLENESFRKYAMRVQLCVKKNKEEQRTFEVKRKFIKTLVSDDVQLPNDFGLALKKDY